MCLCVYTPSSDSFFKRRGRTFAEPIKQNCTNFPKKPVWSGAVNEKYFSSSRFAQIFNACVWLRFFHFLDDSMTFHFFNEPDIVATTRKEHKTPAESGKCINISLLFNPSLYASKSSIQSVFNITAMTSSRLLFCRSLLRSTPQLRGGQNKNSNINLLVPSTSFFAFFSPFHNSISFCSGS